MDIRNLGVSELSFDEQIAIDGGDGYEWGLAVGRFIRKTGEAIADAAEKAWDAIT